MSSEMPSELIRKLLENGVHFGHRTSRWNPKMKKFIFGERSGIYIIDLEKTEECMAKARDFVINITAKGDSILFVGTKKQVQEVVLQEAQRCGMFHVTERWPGGMLTNFSTIRKSINRLKEIETMKQDGTFEKITKKEIALLEKELAKLQKSFSGIVGMERMPKAIFIVDTKKEITAVKEATRLGIPVIGLLDTNGDPEVIDYPIPGNDDATKSVRIIVSYIADSVIEGRKKFLSYLSHEGVAMKQVDAAAQVQAPSPDAEPDEAVIAPEEEVKIKEIEEIIEESTKDEPKDSKKGYAAGGFDKPKSKRKV